MCLIIVIARACLKKLISGGFVPAVSRTQVSGGGECGRFITRMFIYCFLIHISYSLNVEQAGIITDLAADRTVDCDGFPGICVSSMTVLKLF